MDKNVAVSALDVIAPDSNEIRSDFLPLSLGRTRRASDDTSEIQRDRAPTSRSADIFSSDIDTHDHEHVDDKLVMTLPEDCRLELMDQICTDQFLKGKYISKDVVQGRLSQYLKERLHLQQETSRDSKYFWSSLWSGWDAKKEIPQDGGDTDTERTHHESGTERTRGGSGTRVENPGDAGGAGTERTRGGSGTRVEDPVDTSAANLSTPIATLLTDLRMMHDDM